MRPPTLNVKRPILYGRDANPMAAMLSTLILSTTRFASDHSLQSVGHHDSHHHYCCGGRGWHRVSDVSVSVCFVFGGFFKNEKESLLM